ncbi:hypothetical protein QL285_097417 [Trifolium repens]|nr:hypothetical protein QL285_097417 [Trifolium repens]
MGWLKIAPTCNILFFFGFERERERRKKSLKEKKKKEEESKSNPISSACVSLHIRTEKGELSLSRNNTDRHYHLKQRISLELDFTLHAYGSSGCVGCYKRPALVTTVEGPSTKGLTKQGKAVEKPSTSEDFWTTSTHDMDNSIVQSQGSISSTSLNNQVTAPHGSSSNNPSEFVNHGLILWNQTRQRWVGNKKPESRTQQLREPKLSWNATYESLLTSNKPFRQPIPLAEMVDFLVDIWEQDGLYD